MTILKKIGLATSPQTVPCKRTRWSVPGSSHLVSYWWDPRGDGLLTKCSEVACHAAAQRLLGARSFQAMMWQNVLELLTALQFWDCLCSTVQGPLGMLCHGVWDCTPQWQWRKKEYNNYAEEEGPQGAAEGEYNSFFMVCGWPKGQRWRGDRLIGGDAGEAVSCLGRTEAWG